MADVFIMTNFTAADMPNARKPKPKVEAKKTDPETPVETAQTVSKTPKKAPAAKTSGGKKQG